jgi:hypothetical protein
MPEIEQAQFNGWAKVEVMGHQSHIGYVKTEAYGAAVLFRIDTPEFPEREYTLTEPAYVDGTWTSAGAKVRRAATKGVTVLVGAGSIYRIVPCTEAAALRAIEANGRAELKLVEAPPEKAIAAAEPEDPADEDNEQAEQEDDEDGDYKDDPY